MTENTQQPGKDATALKISGKWNKWDKARQTTLSINLEVENHLYYADKNDLYGKLPDIMEISESFISQFSNSTLKSPGAMFNVSLPDVDDKDNLAAIQKAALLKCINKGKAVDAYEEAQENWVNKGEFILFHKWGVDEKPKITSDFKVEQVKYYEGPKVVAVEPKDFTFDVSKKKNIKSSLCGKIYRYWLTPDEILENKDLYPLANKEEIKDLIGEDTDNKDTYQDKEPRLTVDGDQIEILEYWGDITIEGKNLKDRVIAIAAGQYVIRNEENPYPRCPWIYLDYYEDKKTKRGLSALVNCIGLNDKASKIYDATLEGLKKANNPNWLAQKGQLDKKIDLSKGTGEVLEWDNKNGSNVPPQEIQSYKGIPFNFDNITFIEKKIEQVTGINKYASGDAMGVARTAEESRNILSATNIRLSKRVMTLSNKGLIPSIEILADLLALNETEPLDLKYSIPNAGEEIGTITPQIRQMDYEYSIGNSQVIVELKAKLSELMPAIDGLVKLGWKPNTSELWSFASQAFEISDPKKFEMSDPLQDALNMIPVEEQEVVKQMLADLVMQKIQEMNNGLNGNIEASNGLQGQEFIPAMDEGQQAGF